MRIAGLVRTTAFAVAALGAGLLDAGCAFPLSPPLETCQQLSQCPVDKRDLLFQVNAGGPLVAPFAADSYFTNGADIGTPDAIDLSGVDDPAPMAVYQDSHSAPDVSFEYTFTGLDPSRPHFVRLHFADFTTTRSGEHVFNVNVNDQLALNQVDVILEAGGPGKALIREFGVSPDDQGVLTLDFVSLPSKGAAQVAGIEIWRPK